MLNELTAEGFLLLVVKPNNYFTIFASSSSERSTEMEPPFVSFLTASATSFEWYNSITFSVLDHLCLSYELRKY